MLFLFEYAIIQFSLKYYERLKNDFFVYYRYKSKSRVAMICTRVDSVHAFFHNILAYIKLSSRIKANCINLMVLRETLFSRSFISLQNIISVSVSLKPNCRTAANS